MWGGTAQGVYVRGPDGRWSQPEWSPMFERPNALLQIARDDDGAYWLGSQRGLWRVQPGQIPVPVPLGGPGIVKPMRSEEHTSELQSLMRITSAVFCFKKHILTICHTATSSRKH